MQKTMLLPAIKTALSAKLGTAVFIFGTATMLVATLYLSSLRLLWDIVISEATISMKTSFFWQTILAPLDQYGAVMSALVGIASIFFGLNSSLIFYHIKKRREFLVDSNVALSTGAFASGLFSIGCMACGSLLTVFIASFLGGSSGVIALPMGGFEFIVLSIVLLTASICLIAKKIAQPLVCET